MDDFIAVSNAALWLLNRLYAVPIPVDEILNDKEDLRALVELEQARLAEVVEGQAQITDFGRQAEVNPRHRWLLEARKSDLEIVYQMDIFTWRRVRDWILRENPGLPGAES